MLFIMDHQVSHQLVALAQARAVKSVEISEIQGFFKVELFY